MKLFCLLLLFGLSGSALMAQSAGGSTAGQVAAHERRAHELLSEKKPALAAKEFASVVALDPSDIDAQGNLGVLLFFEGNYADAEPHLKATVEAQPSLVKIQALLGMCERHLGKMDQAKADLAAAVPLLKEPGVQVQAGLELVEIYTAEHDLVKASGVIETLRKSSPTDPRVLYPAYRIYTDLAGEALLDLSVAAPDSGQMHQAIAHELARARDTNGAIASFRKAIAADPKLPGIHFELAEALHSSDDPKIKAQAEAEYRLAVAQSSTDEKALARLGDVVAERNDLKDAEAYYKRALALLPGDADALIGLAHVYSEQGNDATALPLLQQVIAADPSNVLAHFRLAAVYRKLHKPEDAKRELAEYQKYRDLKAKLAVVYKDMRIESPEGPQDDAVK
ncbi:hypothetical protein GCM10011507_33740 [Edaphobacter acidisoli]|uniref:Tetratricopeptide repeat protein n=1 Tax=Edaphobacter acidisoli TaxID=2040573 RepID=A0A916WA99_9BACT|nr:tetratricopeptide repeat protein [Edaphobacter acidisoli]GGA79769.1 hypothetical protein GCM10011507_33740 [Edaphobacter acidisoli]